MKFIPALRSFAPSKLPERLIYANGENANIYSLKTGNVLGHIKTQIVVLRNDSYYPNGKGVKSLYIKDLEIKPFARKKGIGAELVKFARNLSKKLGAEGRVHVIAYNYKNPGNAPHKFYRKIGFSASSEMENKAIDFAIENDIPIPPLLTQGSPMYLKDFK